VEVEVEEEDEELGADTTRIIINNSHNSMVVPTTAVARRLSSRHRIKVLQMDHQCNRKQERSLLREAHPKFRRKLAFRRLLELLNSHFPPQNWLTTPCYFEAPSSCDNYHTDSNHSKVRSENCSHLLIVSSLLYLAPWLKFILYEPVFGS
jgi:hypothetical protein